MTTMQTPTTAPKTLSPLSRAWKAAIRGSLASAKLSLKAHGVRPCDAERAWRLSRERAEASSVEAVKPVWRRWLGKRFWAAAAQSSFREATHSHAQSLTASAVAPHANSTSGRASPSSVGLSNAYAKKAFSVATSDHQFSVKPTWVNDVYCRGAASVGGLLTLDLYRIADLPSDSVIWGATWVEQGRGTELRTVRGYMVRSSAGWVHADTITGARRALKRLAAPAPAPKTPRPLPTTVAGLLSRAGLRGTEQVTRLDAVRAGHCRAGIRDWCEKRGLADEAESKTTLELATLAVDSGDRVAEVLGVLLAVKRSMRALAKQEASVAL